MPGVNEYREQLQKLGDWRPYLLKNSGLPGPRGNLELAHAFAELADEARVDAYLAIPAEQAPENSAPVFLVFCAVTALGKFAARGRRSNFARLRQFASDSRWRVREAVAIALQYVGDADMQALLAEMRVWMKGSWYEQRACAAALAEPRLLRDAVAARAVLDIMDHITGSAEAAGYRKDEAFKVLRQSMGYCWSVAVVACPEQGKPLMEKWLSSRDPDVHWILKENLKKSRLAHMDAKWVEKCRRKL